MMHNQDPVESRDISKDKFEFVQRGQQLYDQRIEGEPIGYFKDVWLRFKKNRTNLLASALLLVLILCSIFMPVLSGKEYDKLDEKLSFLPPRVPVLEKFGIMDGTVYIEGMPADLTAIDGETGLYLPLNYNEKAINKDTLTNQRVLSAEKSPSVLNGQSVLRLDHDSHFLTVESTNYFTLTQDDGAYIEVEVFELDSSENSTVTVEIESQIGQPYKVVGVFTEPGTYQINPFDKASNFYGKVISKVRLTYASDHPGSSAAISHVSVFDEKSTAPLKQDEGYVLSTYKIVDGKGSYQRQNGELVTASFEYDRYIAAFDLTHEIAFSSAEYDALISNWEGPLEIIPNPENPQGWFFSEGFPIREVVKENDAIDVDGVSYSSYEVYLDYAAYLGYEDLPYFLFGTSQAGRDMFSLVWIGLRTSLYIGIVVTLINVSIGILFGSISGYYGGTVDLLMQRFAELMGKIPWLVVLSIMVVLFDPGIKTLILTLVISGWIGTASVTRMQFYRYKGREYVLASRTMGASDARLIFRHILPNGIGTIITSSVLSIPSVIFTEAALSYLGYGIGHGQSFSILGFHFSGVSIGVLLSDARNFLFNYPYLTVFPAVIVSLLMITFNMFGNALRDAFNPSLRGVE